MSRIAFPHSYMARFDVQYWRWLAVMCNQGTLQTSLTVCEDAMPSRPRVLASVGTVRRERRRLNHA
jgi:hypothetical protein